MGRALKAARSVAQVALAVAVSAPVTASHAQRPALETAGVVRGDSSAPLTVIEFGDFGCSACAIFARETFPVLDAEFVRAGRIRWRFIPFVLGPFRHAKDAAKAALCAAEQDAFWRMHDVLYKRRGEWMDPRDPLPVFQAYATEMGLDRAAFTRCVARNDVDDRVSAYTNLARKLRVRATPTFLVGEQRVLGALPADDFRRLLEAALQP